jgi:hypothetical protein
VPAALCARGNASQPAPAGRAALPGWAAARCGCVHAAGPGGERRTLRKASAGPTSQRTCCCCSLKQWATPPLGWVASPSTQAGVVCGNEAVWSLEESDGPPALLGMDLVR